MGADFVIAITLRASSIERAELNTLTDILRQSVAIATLQNETTEHSARGSRCRCAAGQQGVSGFREPVRDH
jgi:hypothetical protein